MIFWLRWVVPGHGLSQVHVFQPKKKNCELGNSQSHTPKNLLNQFQLSIVILLLILKKIILSEIRMKDKKYQVSRQKENK